MIVYHGSSAEVRKPDVLHSKRFLDFGRGFYVTTYQSQAERWAERKAMRLGGTPIVSVFEATDHFSGCQVLSFEGYNDEWLDFVCACRRGTLVPEEYDVIIGNVANDDVFKTVDLYFEGIWDKGRTLQELRFFRDNDQIAFVSQKALETSLRFIRSYPVEAAR